MQPLEQNQTDNTLENSVVSTNPDPITQPSLMGTDQVPIIGSNISPIETATAFPKSHTAWSRNKRLITSTLVIFLLLSVAATYFYVAQGRKEALTPYSKEQKSPVATTKSVSNQAEAFAFVFAESEKIFDTYNNLYPFLGKQVTKPKECRGQVYHDVRMGQCTIRYQANSNQSGPVEESKKSYAKLTDTLLKDGWKATMTSTNAKGIPSEKVITKSDQLDFNTSGSDPHYQVTFSKNLPSKIQLLLLVSYYSTPRTNAYSYQNMLWLDASYTYKY